MVMHDQKGSPFFVDINGKKYHIERLDLSEALPPAIPMMGESEQMKSLTDIMKTFDVKKQDDHRTKIAEREYWRTRFGRRTANDTFADTFRSAACRFGWT